MLEAEGFARIRRSRVWMRQDAELRHLCRVEARSDHVQVQWGVLSEVVVPQLWLDPPPDAGERVEYSAMTGWLANMPGHQRESVAAAADAGLAEQASAGAVWLRRFTRRADLVDYLLEVDDAKDRRGFVVPANLPLKLLTCAFLLDADGSPDARGVAARAVEHLGQQKDPLAQHRLDHASRIANRA
jgi:hypothetical protein